MLGYLENVNWNQMYICMCVCVCVCVYIYIHISDTGWILNWILNFKVDLHLCGHCLYKENVYGY